MGVTNTMNQYDVGYRLHNDIKMKYGYRVWTTRPTMRECVFVINYIWKLLIQ